MQIVRETTLVVVSGMAHLSTMSVTSRRAPTTKRKRGSGFTYSHMVAVPPPTTQSSNDVYLRTGEDAGAVLTAASSVASCVDTLPLYASTENI